MTRIDSQNLLIDPDMRLLADLEEQFIAESSNKCKATLKQKIDLLLAKIMEDGFDFRFVFGKYSDGDGFDVVIGNPPYDVLNISDGYTDYQINKLRNNPVYKHALGGKLNLFRLFLSIAFLIMKKNGLVSFIIPYGFMCDSSSKKIREYVLKNAQIEFIEAFPERDDPNKRLFYSAKMSTCVLLVLNEKQNKDFPVRTHYSRNISVNNVPTILLNNEIIKSLDDINLSIPMITNQELAIIKKVYSLSSNKLKNIGRCYEGEINLTFHKKYLTTNSDDSKMVKGAAIQKYQIKSKMSQGIIEYLKKDNYLSDVTGSKSQHHQFNRIVMQGITGVNEHHRLKMSILEPGIFCGNSVNYILLNNNDYHLQFILAILNSSISNWYFKKTSTNSNVNGYEVDNMFIPPLEPADQDSYIKIVDNILAITSKDDYLTNEHAQQQVKVHQNEIDHLIYALYNLTSEEIAIIEGAK